MQQFMYLPHGRLELLTCFEGAKLRQLAKLELEVLEQTSPALLENIATNAPLLSKGTPLTAAQRQTLLELPPAREVLEQSAWRLLDVLLAQREELSA